MLLARDVPSCSVIRRSRKRSWRQGLLVLALLPLVACGLADKIEDPGSMASGMVSMAQSMQARGDIEGATDFYQRALRHDPGNIEASRGLAQIAEKKGDKNASAELFAAAVKAHPNDGELLRAYGRLLLTMDRPADAAEQFDAALALDHKDTRALTGLGVAMDYLGDHAEAQSRYDAALLIDPDNAAIINNLAYSYILSRDYETAIKKLEPLLNDKRATMSLRQNLALAYGLAGLYADAQRVAAIDLAPEQVKKNIEYYKKQRAELAVSSTPFAELGTYATEDLAAVQIEKIKPRLSKSGMVLKPVIAPELTAPGGTPRFTVRMMGCTKPDEVKALCDQLALKGVPCVVRKN